MSETEIRYYSDGFDSAVSVFNELLNEVDIGGQPISQHISSITDFAVDKAVDGGSKVFEAIKSIKKILYKIYQEEYMKKKHMRDKSNPLLKQDNKLYKRAFSLIYIVIYIFWTMGFIGIIIDWVNGTIREGNGIGDVITGIIMWTLFTWFIFGRVLNKNARNSMSAMRGLCTYEELYDLLTNQTFHKVKDVGFENIEESELWLKVDGIFVPKKFIIARYDKSDTHHSWYLNLILLNGEVISYRAGVTYKSLEDTVKYFKKIVRYRAFNDSYYLENNRIELTSKLEEKFKKYKEDGNSIEDLIYNYPDFLGEIGKLKRIYKKKNSV